MAQIQHCNIQTGSITGFIKETFTVLPSSLSASSEDQGRYFLFDGLGHLVPCISITWKHFALYLNLAYTTAKSRII